MKSLLLPLLLVSSVACDPYGFGFKKNPAYVLDEAFKAIVNQDQESFLEVSGKEVLCVYGNNEGMSYLKEKLTVNPENVKINPTVLNSKHFKAPQFVGYWSYYSERYQINIEDKTDKKILMKAIVDCDYGTDGQKNDKFIGLKPKQYKRKECRLTKFIPTDFNALTVPKKCNILRVDL